LPWRERVPQMNTPVSNAGSKSTTKTAAKTSPLLWLADVAPAARPDWIEQHEGWLSASEQARLLRIARAERRAQLLAGHVLLRHLAAACAGVAVHEVNVRSQSDGRPELVAPLGWRPSLAHSKQWVAALLDMGAGGAGVDIELMHPGRQIESIVKLACGIEAESREHAYLVWAQREAEIKAGPGGAGVWVATWSGLALAVCASTSPVAALVDLETQMPARTLTLTWSYRPRLPVALLADGH